MASGTRIFGGARRSMAYGAATRRYPFFISGLIWLAELIVTAAAFSVKVFFRQKIGERTIGFWLVVFAYLWVRYFLIGDREFHRQPNYKVLDYIWLGRLDIVLYPLYVAIDYIWQFIRYIGTLYDAAFRREPGGHSPWVFWYSYAVVILGMIHLTHAWVRGWTHEKWHSLSRGRSLLFGWLEGRTVKLPFGRRAEITVSDTTIWMVLDPLFVFLLGLSVYYYLDDNFGMLLILSAGALAYEEYTMYQERKGEVLNIIDGEHGGRRLEASINKFNEKEGKGRSGEVAEGGAVLAEPRHDKIYQEFIKEQGRTAKRRRGAGIG